MIYLIICLLIILFVYAEAIELSKFSSALFGVITCLIMLFFVALRDKVGTDWLAYYDFYMYKTDEVEIGYATINNFFRTQNFPYYSFLFFINGVSLFLFYKSLKKYVVFFVISLLLFYSDLFLYLNFSGVRQAVAISIAVYSIKYAIDRKFIKFLLCVLLASTFHITSIIFIIAYFVPFRKFYKKEYLLLGGVFFLLSVFIFAFINLLSGDLAYKAKFYLELQEQAANIKSLFLIGAIKRIIIIIMVLVFGKEIFNLKNPIYFFNLYLIGCGMYLTTYLISPDIGVRLSSYFLIFDIFLAGNLIYVNRKLTNRLIIVTIFSIISIYKIYTYMGLKPYLYNSILSN